MAIGTDLQAHVADLVPRIDTSVAAQANRLMRHGDIILRQITAEILGVNPYWRTDEIEWSTAADTSPNEYLFGTGNPIAIDDFMGVQHLYRIISDSTGDYEELRPFDQLRQQHDMGDGREYGGMLTGTSSNKGRPTHYLVNVDSLQIFPISDAIYTMRLWYTKAPAAIAAATAIDVPIAMYQALVYGVAREEAVFRKEKEFNEFHAMYLSAMASGMATLAHQTEGPRNINYVRDERGMYI